MTLAAAGDQPRSQLLRRDTGQVWQQPLHTFHGHTAGEILMVLAHVPPDDVAVVQTLDELTCLPLVSRQVPAVVLQ